jgi:REP element-mobilizing transposase RayT
MGKIFTDTRTPCYAWALLSNHAHLLLKTGSVPLSKVMARLLTGHALSFNRRYGRHGQLFQNRYKGTGNSSTKKECKKQDLTPTLPAGGTVQCQE